MHRSIINCCYSLERKTHHPKVIKVIEDTVSHQIIFLLTVCKFSDNCRDSNL